jgi:hypothetical protein
MRRLTTQSWLTDSDMKEIVGADPQLRISGDVHLREATRDASVPPLMPIDQRASRSIPTGRNYGFCKESVPDYRATRRQMLLLWCALGTNCGCRTGHTAVVHSSP